MERLGPDLAWPVPAQDLGPDPAVLTGEPNERVVPGEGCPRFLPFDNISGAPGDDWIGVGIAEALAAELQSPAAFDVIGPELVSAIRVPDVDDTGSGEHAVVLEVGRRLGARWVVHGAYQRLGDQLRITGRLVDVETSTIVRAVKVDGAIDDLFTLQDRLAAELVSGTGMDSGRASGRPGPRAAVADPRPAPSPVVGDPDPGTVSGIASALSISGFAVGGVIDGPPPPNPPAVISRDERGRATIRAIKLTAAIRLDGQLDEQVYHTVPAVTGFIQHVPDEGALATERTEVWIMFDERNIYVASRIWDSAPRSEWVANEMRRDFNQLRQNDHFLVLFDTFYDRRNGVAFQTTPLGALSDFAITNEGSYNGDWNPVWDVRTGRFEGGWTVEMEIPFKSLRYRPGPAQVWGVQLRRGIRRKSEYAYITPLPISAAGAGGGTMGVFRVSAAATLVGGLAFGCVMRRPPVCKIIRGGAAQPGNQIPPRVRHTRTCAL